MKNLSLIVKKVLITPCPTNKLLRYRVIILSMHISGIAKTAVPFSGGILSKSDSNRTHFTDNVSNFLMADF